MFLSNDSKKKNTFEGNKTKFLNSLDQEGGHKFSTEFNQKLELKNCQRTQGGTVGHNGGVRRAYLDGNWTSQGGKRRTT